jgi:hypothetical protein
MQEIYNVKPGDKAIITNSVNGEKGPSVGRQVTVLNFTESTSDFDANYCDKANATNDPNQYCPPSRYEKHHTKYGQIWPVKSLDGKPFATENGGLVSTVDVPDMWLRKLPPALVAPKQKEVEVI